MKHSLSEFIYIFLTAKLSIDTKPVLNRQTLEENIVLQVRPYDKNAFHPEGFILFGFS